MRPHENLEAWTKSIDLVVEIYKATERFPKEEKYSLTSQLRRAAVSVPATLLKGQEDTPQKNLHILSPMLRDQPVSWRPS